MGAREAEKGLLKLVHPGRFVEIHKEPITAAEVLKRNPRHSVTRPDVFEYPWIVVRPESVLKLGRVFYIVPNYTIYKLIKQKGYSIQPPLRPNQCPRSYVQRQHVEQTSPSNSSAGTTPKHQDHCQSEWQQFQATTCLEEASSEQEQAQFISFADMITQYQSTYKEFKQTSELESQDNKEYPFSEISGSNAAASKQDDAREEEVNVLKPCLRKHESVRKQLHLKVSFNLPAKCEERKRKVTESRTEFESSGFFTS